MTIVHVSVLDIQQLPQFKEMSVFEIINKKNDAEIGKLMSEIGGDTERGVHVQACQHRCNQSKQPVVNYRYVMYERKDREWIRGGKASVSMIIETQKDGSLARDLAVLWQQGATEKLWQLQCIGSAKIRGKGVVSGNDDFPLIKKDRLDNTEEIIDTIISLQHAQAGIRGEVHPYENIFNT